jgi:IS1 family transposase
MSIGYEDKYIEESIHTTFRGLQFDSHLNWKTHIDQLVPKLSRACCAVRSLSHTSNIDTLKLIYFAYFHSLMKYGIIFWGNSSDGKKAFTLQKKTVRIIVGTNSQTPYRDLLRSYRSYYFQTNSAIHCVNTRNNHHLHRPTANLTCFQKSLYYSGIKIFNNLPASLKSLINEKAKFKIALKQYLNKHSVPLC